MKGGWREHMTPYELKRKDSTKESILLIKKAPKKTQAKDCLSTSIFFKTHYLYQMKLFLTSTLVLPGTGTGALSSLKIHVSISRTSCITRFGQLSSNCPVKTPHTESLQLKHKSLDDQDHNTFH